MQTDSLLDTSWGVRSWWTQFWLLTQRTAFSQLRNPADVVSRLALSTWVGIVAGLAAYDIPWTFYDSGQRVVVQFFLVSTRAGFLMVDALNDASMLLNGSCHTCLQHCFTEIQLRSDKFLPGGCRSLSSCCCLSVTCLSTFQTDNSSKPTCKLGSIIPQRTTWHKQLEVRAPPQRAAVRSCIG